VATVSALSQDPGAYSERSQTTSTFHKSAQEKVRASSYMIEPAQTVAECAWFGFFGRLNKAAQALGTMGGMSQLVAI